MAEPCHPALSFVENGAPGSAFPAPLDENDAPHINQQPTLEQTACGLLGPELCAADDPLSAIDEAAALLDTIDTLTTAADAQLDTILLELDQLGHDQVGQAIDDFGAAQPKAESLLSTGDALAVPAMTPVPLITPQGVVAIAPGNPPEQGGIAHAGAPAYTLHQQLGTGWDPSSTPDFLSLEGGNPPFVTVLGFDFETNALGQRRPFARIEINPTSAGTFNGAVNYRVQATIAGLTFHVTVRQPVTVVIQ